MNEKQQEFIEYMLLKTGREGMEDLIKYMNENGFFKAPCSTKYHLCCEGGLAQHSLNVYQRSIDLAQVLCPGELRVDSITIASLLHDLGKMGAHGKPNYVPKILKSGEQSTAEPYTTNKELSYEEHEIRSVIIASKFIELTEEEETAILHHNGLFGKLDSGFGTHNFDSSKLSLILHYADMWVSRFEEK